MIDGTVLASAALRVLVGGGRDNTLRGNTFVDFGRPVRGVLEGSRLVGTPLGRIDDRERVVESGTVTADSVDLAESARAAIAAWRVCWRSMR
jgi:hypothetical protein